MTLHDIQILDHAAAPRPDETAILRLGYVPLTDSAPLLVADQLGLFRKHGVDVELTQLSSWAAMRDRIVFGRLDGGQMLSPMPIAAALGLGGVQAPLCVVSTLARHGNTITLSEGLMAEIAEAAPHLAGSFPLPAKALAAALAARQRAGKAPPVLAVVFAFSSHNYLLRQWLASGGIDPERDVLLCVVPPPMVASELADGRIDGFCAGEPWGSRAVDLRLGRVALTTADVWLNHPEKVLAVSAGRLARHPEQVAACVAAVIEAGIWLTDPAHLAEATRIVHARAVPEVPEEVVALALSRRLVMAPDEPARPVPGLQFHPDATYPHPEHGAWWASQMRRWQHIEAAPPDLPADLIERIWRPDIWRLGAALAGQPTATPSLPPCPGDTYA